MIFLKHAAAILLAILIMGCVAWGGLYWLLNPDLGG
jgi:hypothetical protein